MNFLLSVDREVKNQESVGISVTTHKLNEKNIYYGPISVRVFLWEKEKEKYIMQYPPLNDDKSFGNWARDDAQIMIWL